MKTCEGFGGCEATEPDLTPCPGCELWLCAACDPMPAAHTLDCMTDQLEGTDA